MKKRDHWNENTLETVCDRLPIMPQPGARKSNNDLIEPCLKAVAHRVKWFAACKAG